MSYAHGGSAVTLVTNYIGQMMNDGGQGPGLLMLYQEYYNSRVRVYNYRGTVLDMAYMEPGYVKSDLSLTHRLHPKITAIINITNLGNTAHSDLYWLSPALGRVSTFGLLIRLP